MTSASAACGLRPGALDTIRDRDWGRKGTVEAGSKSTHFLRIVPRLRTAGRNSSSHHRGRTVALKSDTGGQPAKDDSVGKTLRALHSMNHVPKKWLGQHYMVNDTVCQRTVAAARIQAGDVVLEVGPGTGALTQALLDRGATVLAVEKDPEMAALVAERFASDPRVQIVNDDFLKWNLFPPLRHALGDTNKTNFRRAKVVSNLPFNITTDVIRKVLPVGDLISTVVLMLQDEAALRLVDISPASADYRRISLFVQYYAEAKYEFYVGRSSFLPPPKVDAAVVSFALKQPCEYPPVASHKGFFSMVNAAFAGKRKMLRNSLQHIFSPPEVMSALSILGLPPTSRPEEITLDQFLSLYNTLHGLKEGGDIAASLEAGVLKA